MGFFKKYLLPVILTCAVAAGGELLLSWRALPTLQSDVKAAQEDIRKTDGRVDKITDKVTVASELLHELNGEMKGTREDLKSSREDMKALRETLEREIRTHSQKR
jgi:peptidoglycan hydrolase CwlO-like protein